VSLRYSPSKHGSGSSNNAIAIKSVSPGDSPSSLIPMFGKDSSGESSNVDGWFESSNNQVRNTGASFIDNEPPFFMQHSSSGSPQEGAVQSWELDDNTSSLPRRTGLLRLGTHGSSTGDFRDVIDDLTVENKKLKRKLRKYEKLHDAHLEDDRLFEVRMHGLPPEKKIELEETLRQFAASVDASRTAAPTKGYASLTRKLEGHKKSFSHAQTDSAYASMSASGEGSSAQSVHDRVPQMTSAPHLASQRQNIHDYLHHIPAGLLPHQNPTALSEHAKKTLVVRRLEQLFAGKSAPGADNQQSLQQEEVSQRAATADSTAIEASGQHTRKEGSREANIMTCESEEIQELAADESKPAAHFAQQSEVDPFGATAVQSPAQGPGEQRPTRPLDLDPYRAQNTTENIQYMRHFGFSPQHPGSAKSPADGHGWMYLNLLTNMAQLHTINVTDDFVRKALADLGSNFEVSTDGRRARWKGELAVTRTSSDSSEISPYDHVSALSPGRSSPRKRAKLSHGSGAQSMASSAAWSGGTTQRRKPAINKYAYTPMFSHREGSDATDSSTSGGEADGVSPPVQGLHGNPSGVAGSGARTTSYFPAQASKTMPKHDDGPIIFYNKARFCTDLSGDLRSPGQHNSNPPTYNRASSVPLGKASNVRQVFAERRGLLARAHVLPEPLELDDNLVSSPLELSFMSPSPQPSETSDQEPSIDFEVSGIGGVRPADNFAISISSRHARVVQTPPPSLSASFKTKTLPPAFAEILHGSLEPQRPRPPVHREVIASNFHELPPSKLPDALTFMSSDEDLTSEYESDDEDTSRDLDFAGASPRPAAPQLVNFPYTSDDEADSEAEDSDDEDNDSDGEVDFLAAARQLDPEAVRQQEREYDANMAERLAEEIPTGSSAATDSGGSGFSSPQDVMNRAEHQRASREARVKAANLRHAQADRMRDASDGSEADEGSGSVRS